MTGFDAIRIVIILSAGAVTLLWVQVGLRTHQWLWPAIALGWLIPVIAFFVLRYLFSIAPTTLNMISLALYLMAITALGGVALAKLKYAQAGQRG